MRWHGGILSPLDTGRQGCESATGRFTLRPAMRRNLHSSVRAAVMH